MPCVTIHAARRVTFNNLSHAALLLSLALVGCGGGGSGGEPATALIPVTGTVQMAGKPLCRASVVFTPHPGTPGTGAYGVTDDTGKYDLEHKSKKKGIEAGTYVVTIMCMQTKDGQPIPEGKTAADVQAVQIVPAPMGDPSSDNAAKKVTVSAGIKPLDFVIQ